jgi:DNA polymerase (family X)
MTNKEIAAKFDLLANLMELYQENPFKIKSYQNAYRLIRSMDRTLDQLSMEEIQKLPGIGQAISEKIEAILKSGTFSLLEQYLEKTPPGILDLLQIKGLGPKKIKTIWEQLEVDSIGALLYAIYENRLIELNGFGQKTQNDIKQKLEFYTANKHFYRISTAKELLKTLTFPFYESGESRQNLNFVSKLTIIIDKKPALPDSFEWQQSDRVISTRFPNGLPLDIIVSTEDDLGNQLFEYSSPATFKEKFHATFPKLKNRRFQSEELLFHDAGIPYIPPEIRWDENLIGSPPPSLIELKDIKGLIHCHSNYSDGTSSIETMANYAIQFGLEYMVITDHSKSAFYANGLSEERVLMQGREIDELNKKLFPFKIFKGIEADILSSGSLDYEDAFLRHFDVIIASIHSHLKMDMVKSMDRLLHAIHHPFTHILGHPTGRLILSREGYPVDHRAIIDACAANNVAIELNANPYRLDLDWEWLPYAQEKGVLISINPDAHQPEGIQDLQYGIFAGRRGKLSSNSNLSSKNRIEFENWIDFQKQKRV